MKKRNTLYNAYLEKKEESANKKKLLEKYNISNNENTIIINKNKTRFINIIISVIGKIIKIIVMILFFILVSLGATVLINEELRNIVFDIFKLA